MKKLLISLSMLALTAPAAAMAQQGGPAMTTSAHVEVSAHATTLGHNPTGEATPTRGPKPLLPKLGPAIKEITHIATTTRQKLEDMHAAISKHREEAIQHAGHAKQEARERFGDHVQKAVGNIVDRLTKAADELSNIAVRIDTFIKAKQAAGISMSGSTAALATATADIATAQAKVADASAAIETALATSTPQAQMATVRASVKAAEEALKTAKQSLRSTLQAIRIEVGASTTAATSATH